MSPVRQNPTLLVLILLCATSCEEAPDTTPDGGTPDAGGGSLARTLDTCEATVASEVPEFFKSYFLCSDIRMDGSDVLLTTRNLPPYKTWYYGRNSPNFAEFDYSRGTQYRPNPNFLREQRVTVRIPMSPTSRGLIITPAMVDGVGGGAADYPLGPAGLALNSVVLFNPLARPGDDIENEKYTFDDYNAHPQEQGTYHYHQYSKGPLEVLGKLGLVTKTNPGEAEIELYGIMCDGTLVLGCTELSGAAPDKSGFDAQNGHVHDIASRAGTVFFTGRYHVHICPSWTDKPRKFTPEIQYYTRCTLG
jgi:hypothetical protein